MLRTGKEHLESIRDGRVVYIGSERVDDVTRHPAFRNAAQTVAAIYDMKADPALRDEMTFEEDGGRHSIYYLRARSRDDLQRRMIGHRRIADFTYGMFGRSPDHVASFVTGMAMKPDELKAPCGHPDNLLAYYRHIRDNDIYAVYAVVPPQAARNPEFYQRQNIPVPTLARRARGRCRRRHLRHEDAGDRRRLRQRNLDRQRHPARARPEEGGDHLRHSLQRAGPATVVAPAVRARLHLRIRFAARLSLRRERQHADVRRGQGAVGARLRARRRAAVARHLRQDAEPLLRQSSIERALLVEDAACWSGCAARSRTRPAPIRFRRCARRWAGFRRRRR